VNFIKTIILFLIFSQQILPQEDTKTLAKVGNKTITVEEFKHRFELAPQINRKQSDINNAKEELLYTLISEKLFAQKAEELNLDTLEVIETNYIPLKKLYVRDALYKKEIKNKVQLDNFKFIQGLKRASYKLFINYIYSLDEKKIHFVHKQLQNTSNFDSLAGLLKNIEFVDSPYEIIFGKMSTEAEDAIYSLELTEYTKPIKAPEGWYIFRLISSEPIFYKSENEKISKVKKIVKSRIEDSIYNDFWQNFFKGKKVTTDGNLFWYLAENLQNQIQKLKAINKINEEEKISLTNKDFIELRSNLESDSLKREFFKVEGKSFTLNDFLTEFMFEGFFTYSTKLKTIASQLNSRVKRQIENELLTNYGFKKGYENLPEVKKTTTIWKENYLATLYKKQIIKNSSVTEQDIRQYITKNSLECLKETQVKIIEILTDSLEVIEKAIQIKEEKEFKEFAKLHSQMKNTFNDSLIFFPISKFGEIGKIAESMNVGDVYGPLQTSKGYSVFKLIDKRENELSLEAKNISTETGNKIRYQKALNNLEEEASNLATEYKVQINEGLLNSIKVINMQMMVFRYMGFGGRILAVPNTVPFYNWKKKWELKKKDLL